MNQETPPSGNGAQSGAFRCEVSVSLFDSIPKFTTDDQRIDWAGERIWDIAEGALNREDAQFVHWWLSGLADDPSKTSYQRQQYALLIETLRATMSLRWPS